MADLLNTIMSFSFGDWLAIASVVIAIITPFILPFITNQIKNPMFYLSEEDIPASSRTHKDLHIFWKDQEIPNAKSIEISFFNKGKIPILKSDLTTPFSITTDIKDLQVLNAEIISKSRQELSITVNIIDDKIQIVLNNNEAFEKDDGFKVKIFYAGYGIKSNWSVNARIIGVKKGIKKSLASPKWFYHPLSLTYSVLIMAIAGIGFPHFNLVIVGLSIIRLVFLSFTSILRIPNWVLSTNKSAERKKKKTREVGKKDV